MEIIRFHAEWCGPCKAMQPIVDKVFSDDKYSSFTFKDIDVDDDDDDLTSKFKIRNVPTILVINDNDEVVDKMVGSGTETDLRNFLNKHC